MKYVRLTVNLIEHANAALMWLVNQTGYTRTDIINRALQLYKVIEEERATGQQILIRNPETGETQQLRLL